MSDPIKDLAQLMFANKLNQLTKWYDSPKQVALRAEYRQQWLARPWHERVLIRSRSKLRAVRTRLGEWISGQSFDD